MKFFIFSGIHLEIFNFQGIIKAMCRGLGDSLKGAVVLYNLNKQINEKLKKAALKSNSKRSMNPNSSSPSVNSKDPR